MSKNREYINTALCPKESHAVCGMKILSDTLSDTGYGNSLQSAQGGTHFSRKLITQEFGVPGDSGLWESHSGRVGEFTNTRLCIDK